MLHLELAIVTFNYHRIYRLRRSDFKKFIESQKPCPSYITSLKRVESQRKTLERCVIKLGSGKPAPEPEYSDDVAFYCLVNSSWSYKSIAESHNAPRQAMLLALAAVMESYAIETYRGTLLDSEQNMRVTLDEIVKRFCISETGLKRGFWADGYLPGEKAERSETIQQTLRRLNSEEFEQKQTAFFQKIIDMVENHSMAEDVTGEFVSYEVALELTVLCMVGSKIYHNQILIFIIF
jgi:hypothetical protein